MRDCQVNLVLTAATSSFKSLNQKVYLKDIDMYVGDSKSTTICPDNCKCTEQAESRDSTEKSHVEGDPGGEEDEIHRKILPVATLDELIEREKWNEQRHDERSNEHVDIARQKWSLK